VVQVRPTFARDLDYVSLEQARSIDELVQALREAAGGTTRRYGLRPMPQ
jgi:hypothetical protein